MNAFAKINSFATYETQGYVRFSEQISEPFTNHRADSGRAFLLQAIAELEDYAKARGYPIVQSRTYTTAFEIASRLPEKQGAP